MVVIITEILMAIYTGRDMITGFILTKYISAKSSTRKTNTRSGTQKEEVQLATVMEMEITAIKKIIMAKEMAGVKVMAIMNK